MGSIDGYVFTTILPKTVNFTFKVKLLKLVKLPFLGIKFIGNFYL